MIPQLPTDNLYKFATLGGIVLLVFCVWSLRDNSVQMDRGMTSYNQVANELDALLDDLDNDQAKLGVEIARVNDLITEAKKPENVNNASKAQTAIEAYQELAAANEVAHKKRFEARRAKANADTQSSDLKMLLERISRELDQIFWLWVTGAAITASGISSWYFKHQRYQDALLRVQLDNARRLAFTSSLTTPAEPQNEG